MSKDDQVSPGGIQAPAATRGARAIDDILAALAARLPERPPAERPAPADDTQRDTR